MNKIKQALKNKKVLFGLAGAIILILGVVLFFVLNRSQVYTVTFDSDGGSEVTPVKVKEGETVAFPADPTKAGFKFNGWLSDGKVFVPSTKITADVKLTAGWISEDAKTFKVTFNADNNHEPVVLEVVENTAVAQPSNPNKDGFEFGGWFLNGTGYDFNTPVTADITLTAQWKEVAKAETKPKPAGSVAVTGVSLNKTSLDLRKGNSETLTASVAPTNATDKSVTWSSSNSGVATVNGGTVAAVATGSATITVKTANGKTAIANVTVTNPVTGLQLSYNRTYLYRDNASLKSATPKITFIPADADASSKAGLTYRGTGNIGGPTSTLSLNNSNGALEAVNYAGASSNQIWAECNGVTSNKVTIVTEARLQNGFNAFPSAPSCADLTLNKSESKTISLNTGANVSYSASNYAGVTVNPLSGNSITIKAGTNATDMSSPINVSVTSYAGQKGCFSVAVR